MKNKSIPIFAEGPFTQYILDFIDYKRSSGVKYENSAEYTLRYICNYINNCETSILKLSKEIVEEIAQKKDYESYATQSKRITFLRQFAIYLNLREINAYIYPKLYIRKHEKKFAPYIFTDDEINQIFNIADHLPYYKHYPFYNSVYPTLIRLLYATGLRLSEALYLRIRNFDSIENILYIDKSKNMRSRFVPISESMAIVLKRYIKYRYGEASNTESYIFEAPDGDVYNRSSIRSTIMKIYNTINLPGVSLKNHPNVHSFRHNFAIRALNKMEEAGMDLYHTLPILAVYLGHNGIRELEQYLWLSQSKHNEITQSSSNLIENLIPEVNWNEK